jgi:hypothetical protein
MGNHTFKNQSDSDDYAMDVSIFGQFQLYIFQKMK